MADISDDARNLLEFIAGTFDGHATISEIRRGTGLSGADLQEAGTELFEAGLVECWPA